MVAIQTLCRTTPMSENDKSSEGWAKQVYEFWRLFLRLGDTFAGLLLSEVGFLLVLGLVAGLGPSDKPPGVLLPIPVGRFPANLWNWEYAEMPLTYLVVPGSIAVFILWCFTSGHTVFFVRPALRLIRPPLFIIVQILFIIIAIVHLPIEWLLRRQEKAQFEKWKKTLNDAQRKVLDQESLDVQIATYRQRERTRQPDFMLAAVGELLIGWMREEMSAATICLAPLYAHSYAEDEQASRAKRQFLAHAFNRLRIRMRSLAAGKYIQFLSLPPSYAPRDLRSAMLLRRWLNADLLLWGSFDRLTPPTLWMNFEDETLQRVDETTDQIGAMGRHPYDPIVRTQASVVLPLDNGLDPYIFAVMAIVRVLESRQHSNFWYIFPSSLRDYGDRLKLRSNQEGAIVGHLLEDVIVHVSEPVTEDAFAISPRAWLVGFLSDWLAHQELDPLRIHFDDDKRYEGERLCAYFHRLADLQPHVPEHWYRLGAAYLLTGQVDKGMTFVRQAQAIDKQRSAIRLEDNRIGAYVHLTSLDFPAKEREVVNALVHVARALATGSEGVKDYLRKALEEHKHFPIWRAMLKDRQAAEPQWVALLGLLELSPPAQPSAADPPPQSIAGTGVPQPITVSVLPPPAAGAA